MSVVPNGSFVTSYCLLWDQSVAGRPFTQQGAVLASTPSRIQALSACCFEAPLFKDFGQNLQLEHSSLSLPFILEITLPYPKVTPSFSVQSSSMFAGQPVDICAAVTDMT